MLKKFFRFITYLLLICFILLIQSIFLQKSISSKIIRLHILANSNSEFDQTLKLKVRNEIITYLTPLLKNSKNLKQSEEIISSNIPKINSLAQKIVSNSANYKTITTLDTSVFPTKHYGDFSFPAGKYKALKISIGEAKGNNWWCVMFPPLCFNNSNSIAFDNNSIEFLEKNFSKKEFYTISNYNKSPIKLKFKLLEWLNY